MIILIILDILIIYKWYYWKKQYKKLEYLINIYEIKLNEKRGTRRWKY